LAASAIPQRRLRGRPFLI